MDDPKIAVWVICTLVWMLAAFMHSRRAGKAEQRARSLKIDLEHYQALTRIHAEHSLRLAALIRSGACSGFVLRGEKLTVSKAPEGMTVAEAQKIVNEVYESFSAHAPARDEQRSVN